eukprot:GHRQ01032608.1.p1 GENE.GHRQ01032608.1~~GHRQ01032608.1.p1  ORF type:complete len:143 (+),score=17.88 GHRQ01032608.1:276-704(+)
MLLAEPSPEQLLAAVEAALEQLPGLDPQQQHERVSMQCRPCELQDQSCLQDSLRRACERIVEQEVCYYPCLPAQRRIFVSSAGCFCAAAWGVKSAAYACEYRLTNALVILWRNKYQLCLQAYPVGLAVAGSAESNAARLTPC